MAQAIVQTEIGGPEVLTLVEVPDPVPAPDGVVVRIEAAGVNPIDVKQRSGLRPLPPITEPRHLGFDGAGVVTAVGAEVTDVAVGARVAVRDTRGTYATALAVPSAHLTALPDAVTSAEGASLGIPAGTAYQSLRSLDVGAGDLLLLHAGSGAVGQAAIQFAVAWGASVIATGGRASQERLRELGAIPVEYGPGLEERIRAAADGREITVSLDGAGTDEAVAASLALVADRQRIATIVRGPDAAALGIRAFSGGSPVPLSAQELAWRAEAVPVAVALIAEGRFSIEFGPELPLADAAEAHRLIEDHAAHGKIILRP
ncbi:quinone oxidoreductase family protein [Microbacterium azadirachtae]|uniref:quinone oxidoreductase family protein n=1 Tax=Microbacterium azadirachtae TaxID=582680 RepID=UPI003F7522A0